MLFNIKGEIMKVLKKMIKPKQRMINFRATEEEEKLIKDNAKLFAKGNISMWIRYITVHGKPHKSDLANG